MTLQSLGLLLRSRSRRVSMFQYAVVAFGLLLWARFIIVTGHPRTAVAVPPRLDQEVSHRGAEPQSVLTGAEPLN